MPSEEEVFGEASGAGGALSAGTSGVGGTAAGAGAGSSATSGGSAGSRAGGGGQSGATSAGASGRGGTPSAGTGGRDVTSGGAGGAAPSSGGTAGESGEGNGGGIGGEGGGSAGSAGLAAHFPFDQDSGPVVANAVDSSKPATCAGTCSFPEGRHGRAVGIRNQADNTDWIELPPGLFRGLSAASVAVWVRDLSTARQGGRLFHFSAGPDEE
ncbi:MAG TPA: hypothetical protein VGK73_34270, partial [Polyangiaceae bacterium]